MMKRIGLACTVLTLWGGAAHAQWIVSDPATEAMTAAQYAQSVAQDAVKVANQVSMLNNQLHQLIALRDTLISLNHGNLSALADVMPELGSLGLTNPLGTDTSGTIQALSGLGSSVGGLTSSLSTTQALAQNLLQSDQYFSSSVGDFRALSLNTTASGLAAQKAAVQTLLTATGQRITSLTALRNNLGGTTDVKGAADATARLAGEQATAQEHTNQLLAMQGLARVQAATNEAQEQQLWRCASERLVAQSKAAAASAGNGTVNLVSDTNSTPCTATTVSQANTVASNATGTLTTASASNLNSTALLTMTNQSWGQQAANNAASIGVNPTALAATCVIESNCQANPGGSGTISGAFQMSDGTYAQTVKELQASNPDAAALITTKNDPASQALASAQYLKDGATALQKANIANPTVLDVRGYYNFGPAYAAQVASASDNQLMSTTLSGMSSASLTANGISSNTTVGQWRQSVISKIGADAASQSVLLGSNA